MMPVMLEAVSHLPILDRLLDQVSGCFSDDVRRALLDFRADDAVTGRIDELARKCDAGTLTPQERSEYETYVDIGDLIAVLQAKARHRLGETAA